jgi:hypothetical protein
MTLPRERTRAVQRAQRFLLDLMDAKTTPRVPAEIRREARAILRHYPTALSLAEVARHVPEIFGQPDA